MNTVGREIERRSELTVSALIVDELRREVWPLACFSLDVFKVRCPPLHDARDCTPRVGRACVHTDKGEEAKSLTGARSSPRRRKSDKADTPLHVGDIFSSLYYQCLLKKKHPNEPSRLTRLLEVYPSLRAPHRNCYVPFSIPHCCVCLSIYLSLLCAPSRSLHESAIPDRAPYFLYHRHS